MRIDSCASLVCLREHVLENPNLVVASDSDPVADVINVISKEIDKEKIQEYDLSMLTMAKA